LEASGRRGGRREEGLGREAVMRRWEEEMEEGAMVAGGSLIHQWSLGKKIYGEGRERLDFYGRGGDGSHRWFGVVVIS
jgi:hypothetical protein